MKSIRTALLVAAAALVVAPAFAGPETAQSDEPRPTREARSEARAESRAADRAERADRSGGGWQRQTASTPSYQPQQRAEAPSAPPVARTDWSGGRQARSSGDQRAQGNRGQWDRNAAAPPQPSQPSQPASATANDRSQWTRGDAGRWNRNDGQQGGNAGAARDYRRNDGQGDRNDRRWDNDNRRTDNRDSRTWNGNDRRGNDNGNSYRNGRNDHRQVLNWRNDRRYDWRSYRENHRSTFRRGYYRAPHGYDYGYRSVYAGFYLEPLFYSSNYWLSDPYEYRLPPVEWPYRWVRYYDDALLVDTTSGEVVDVIQSFFY